MEHLTQKQIEDYSQRLLSGAELLAASDHLAACETCRRRLETLFNSDVTFIALREETLNPDLTSHLTPGQTANYLDQNLAGEELQIVSDHLIVCEQCVLAVEDLRGFRNDLAMTIDREYRPAVAVPASPLSAWKEKFVSFFRVSPIPAFGSAAVVVIILATIGWLIWRTPRERDTEIVAAPTPSLQPSPSPEAPVEAQPAESTAAVVAQLNDGDRVLALDEEGKLTGAENLPPSYQNLIKKALATQRIERSPEVQGLSRPPSSLMSSDNQEGEFFVMEPVGSVLLRSQPTFLWSIVEGATGYVVEVYDEQFSLVAASPRLKIASWSVQLPRGAVYSWQVKAIKDGQEIIAPRPPAPQAKFRILDQAKANELARARRAYASSHLALGLLYAEAGLLKEAEQQFRLLRRSNPNSSLARRLHRQILALQP